MACFDACRGTSDLDSIRAIFEKHEFLSKLDLFTGLGIKTFRDLIITSLDDIKKLRILTYIEQKKFVNIQIECAKILKLDPSDFIVQRIDIGLISHVGYVEDEHIVHSSDDLNISGFDTPPTSLSPNGQQEIMLMPNFTENYSDYEIKPDQYGYIGLGIILVNLNYGDEIRKGGEQDFEMIKQVFEDMGLKIVELIDRESHDLVQVLKGILATHHIFLCNTSCLLMAISSHGSNDSISCPNGESLSISEQILPLFKSDRCEALQSKPKIFLIHACRGPKNDYEIQEDYDGQQMSPNTNLKTVATIESDILIGYSCVENYKALRDIEKGSWYIQAFKESYFKMKKTGIMDIYSILTLTNRYILSEFECLSVSGVRKQPSQFTSSLTRSFKFP